MRMGGGAAMNMGGKHENKLAMSLESNILV